MDIALFVLPATLASSSDKLCDILASWAAKAPQSSFLVRFSGPVALPGSEAEVWIIETPSIAAEFLAEDLSMRARAVVGLRIKDTVGAIAHVFTRDRAYDVTRTDDPRDIEPFVTTALGKLYGPLDAPAGWLSQWIDAHVASRELRVLRWNHERPKGDAWPFGYAMPTENDWRIFTGLYDVETLAPSKARC